MATNIKTIVVADDEPIVRELLSMKLREREFDVYEAADGKEALDIIKEKEPDLVLLDVKMPVMDGLKVCQLIKENKEMEKIKILMFSAKAELVDRSDGLRAGADYYLTKPARFAEIIKIIDQMKP